jgi:hypothetical protein
MLLLLFKVPTILVITVQITVAIVAIVTTSFTLQMYFTGSSSPKWIGIPMHAKLKLVTQTDMIQHYLRVTCLKEGHLFTLFLYCP